MLSRMPSTSTRSLMREKANASTGQSAIRSAAKVARVLCISVERVGIRILPMGSGSVDARSVPVLVGKLFNSINSLIYGSGDLNRPLGRFFRAKIAFGHMDLDSGDSYFAEHDRSPPQAPAEAGRAVHPRWLGLEAGDEGQRHRGGERGRQGPQFRPDDRRLPACASGDLGARGGAAG